jgi:hypothetical protein
MAEYAPGLPNATELSQYLPLTSPVAGTLYAPGFQVRSGTAVGELKPNAVEIRSTTGSTRWRIQVNDSGVISATSI